MPNHLSHFAINADDVKRARRFYERVFGWGFQPWGPPDFLQINTGDKKDASVMGALQKRREIVPGDRMIGYECSFSVANVDAVAAAVEANGGKVVMPKVTLTGVGRLIFFKDTEGNIAGAMEYDATAE
jgi:predicted enzyme related to lactoylglutathione lyase